METITLEQLAEKLNGKLWVKGDMKRIYLDRGHNTKKMSTKTYVYLREDGSFGVSCFIDCPSQNATWIRSQQNKVIDGVEGSIQRAIFEINNPDLDYDEVKEVEQNQKQLSEDAAKFLKEIPANTEMWQRDYQRSIKEVAEYDAKVELFNNAPEDVKNVILKLESEYKGILGTPGSKNRRIEIDQELSLLPAMPSGPGYAYGADGWMRIAASFATVEQYIDFKIAEGKEKYQIND